MAPAACMRSGRGMKPTVGGRERFRPACSRNDAVPAQRLDHPQQGQTPSRVVEGLRSYLPADFETYSATARIWASLRRSLNAGIWPLPFVTRSTASSTLGLA